MAIKGDLKDVSLVNLMQLICLEKRQSVLMLKGHHEEGVIFFDKGEIIHAKNGTLVGVEAVYHLLSWTSGLFQIKDGITIPRRTITLSWNHILMEGLKKIDERLARKDGQQHLPRPISQADREQDNALEDTLILLLSQLENLCAQLVHKKIRKRPAQSLLILAEMVNQLSIISEPWLRGETNDYTLKKVLQMAGDAYPAVRLLSIQHNHLEAKVIASLYQSWGGDGESRHQTFQEIARGLLDVLETYFLLLTAHFCTPNGADQSRETSNTLLTEIRNIVETIPY